MIIYFLCDNLNHFIAYYISQCQHYLRLALTVQIYLYNEEYLICNRHTLKNRSHLAFHLCLSLLQKFYCAFLARESERVCRLYLPNHLMNLKHPLIVCDTSQRWVFLDNTSLFYLWQIIWGHKVKFIHSTKALSTYYYFCSSFNWFQYAYAGIENLKSKRFIIRQLFSKWNY